MADIIIILLLPLDKVRNNTTKLIPAGQWQGEKYVCVQLLAGKKFNTSSRYGRLVSSPDPTPLRGLGTRLYKRRIGMFAAWHDQVTRQQEKIPVGIHYRSKAITVQVVTTGSRLDCDYWSGRGRASLRTAGWVSTYVHGIINCIKRPLWLVAHAALQACTENQSMLHDICSRSRGATPPCPCDHNEKDTIFVPCVHTENTRFEYACRLSALKAPSTPAAPPTSNLWAGDKGRNC